MKLLKGFDRDLRLLLYSMALRQVVMAFFNVVRTIYLALIGFSPLEIGLLLTTATFVSALHHIAFALLSDRFGRKPFLVLGNLFAVIRMALFAITTSFPLLAIAQGIGGLGEGVGAGQPVVSGYITDKTKTEQRASVFTTIAISNGVAATLGSLLAGAPSLLQEAFKLSIVNAHSILFWGGVAASVSSLIVIAQLEEPELMKGEYVSVDKRLFNTKSLGMIGRFTLVRATSGLGWGLIDSLLPLYFFLRFGVGSEILGPIYALTRFLSVFSYLFIPRLVERFGEITPLIASRLLTAFLAATFSLTDLYPLATVLLVTFRILILFTMPIRQTFATHIVNPRETATAIGISNFARMTLRSIAPTVAGYMFEAISLTTPLLSGAGFFVANAVLYRSFFRKKRE